ncbi:MAG: outer membrane beta-barrel protein, partial [Candidatus Aminicenantes bacterium]|nr:outer membrane beta-barrel protein [Candidatus Aminicenantes bacterium]
MKLRLFLAAALLALVLPSYLASQQKEVIIGTGGGYSLSLDAAASPWEIDWAPGEIYFKEHMKLKESFSFNVQYFFNKEIGLQLEFHHQKASYFSQLEWYGLYIESFYIDIDHIEEPYTKPWSISSLSVSLFIAKRQYFNQKVFPYAFVGAGLYFLEGDREFVLSRFRLGPRKTGELFKLGGGFKYRLNRFLLLNFRFFGQSIWRKEARYRSSLYGG